MGNPKIQFRFLCGLFGAIWLCCFLASVVYPPFLGYYTFDETFISDSGVFVWYGKTPRILDWPASPSVLIYTLIFGVAVCISVVKEAGNISGITDVFDVIDKTAFTYLADREPYILAGRTIQLLLVAFVIYRTLRFLFRQEHPLLTGTSRLLLGILIVTSHLFWNGGVVLRPEAISGTVFLYVLCRLLFSVRLEPAQAGTLAFLYGIVVAERLIFLFMAPLFFLGIYLLSPRLRFRETAGAVGIFLLSFVVFCPFVLSDPLILAKAFLGGIFAKLNDSPMTTMFNWEYIRIHFENPVSYIMLGLCVAGAWRLLRSRNLFYGVVIGNWLLFLFLVLRSSKIYDPHVLPGALVGLMVAALGLSGLAVRGRRASYAALGLAAVIAVSELFVVAAYQRWTHEEQNEHHALNWIKSLPSGTRLLVNIGIGIYLPKNEATLERELAANNSMEHRVRKLHFLMGTGTQENGPAKAIPLAASAFAFEDEALYELQYRLLLKYARKDPAPRYDYDIYLDNPVLVYHAIPFTEGLDRFRNGAYTYLVTEEEVPGLVPEKEFTGASGAAIRVYRSTKKEGEQPL